MISGWMYTGEILSGLYIGVGVFLTWALSRELDPKHDYSALLAAVVSLLNVFLYENIQLLLLFWILLLMRILNGITGKKLTTLDIFSVLTLSVYLSWRNQNSIYILIFALAMSLVIKVHGKTKATLLALGISLIGFTLESFLMQYFTFNFLSVLQPFHVLTLFVSIFSFVSA